MSTLLVGIAGPSGAGKSNFCRKFEREHSNVGRLKLDDFFCDLKDVQIINGYQNWDDPKNINWKCLVAAANRLRAGGSATVPHYDRATDRCVGEKCIIPKEIIIVDGFMTLHHPELRDILDLSFFFDLNEEQQVIRRKMRQPWVQDGYLHEIMIPSARKYVIPTKQFADHIIDGSQEVEIVYKLVRSIIGGRKTLVPLC